MKPLKNRSGTLVCHLRPDDGEWLDSRAIRCNWAGPKVPAFNFSTISHVIYGNDSYHTLWSPPIFQAWDAEL